MAGDISTAGALMLERSLSVLKLSMTNIGISVVICWFNFKPLISFKFKSNSWLLSFRSWIKENQMVESTGNESRGFGIARDNSVTKLSKLEGSMSAFPFYESVDSHSWFDRWLTFVRCITKGCF